MFSFFKKSKQNKAKINFFKWRSTEPNALKANVIAKLNAGSNPDNYARVLRNQSRNTSTDISLASGFFETICAEILGEQGLILDISSGDSAFDERIEKEFFKWEKECCFYGVYDFEDIEEMALISFYRDGEIFLRFHNEPFKIELINAEKIDDNYASEASGIKYGIEREEGSIKAKYYYLRKNDRELIKIPANEILHIKKGLIPEQYRGISKLASAISDLNDKDRLKSSEIDRATLASKITGFFVRKDSGMDFGGGIDGDEKDVIIPNQAIVGKMEYLDENLDVKFVEPHAPQNIEFYLKSTDREIAKALGISYHTFTGDLSEVNYSSIRHGTMSERRQFRRIQNFFKRKFHAPIFESWLLDQLLSGKISPKDYKQALNNYTFKPQGWEYIDPTKEVNANKVAIDSGFKTISEVLREKGIEHDTFMADLDKDTQIATKLRELKKIKGEKINS